MVYYLLMFILKESTDFLGDSVFNQCTHYMYYVKYQFHDKNHYGVKHIYLSKIDICNVKCIFNIKKIIRFKKPV